MSSKNFHLLKIACIGLLWSYLSFLESARIAAIVLYQFNIQVELKKFSVWNREEEQMGKDSFVNLSHAVFRIKQIAKEREQSPKLNRWDELHIPQHYSQINNLFQEIISLSF